MQSANLPDQVSTNPTLFSCIGSSAEQHKFSTYGSSMLDVIKRVATSSRNVTEIIVGNATESIHCIEELDSKCATPETECSNNSLHVKLSCDSVCLDDSDLIPDTPQNANTIADRKKFQRSFLSMSTNVLTDRIDVDKKKVKVGCSSKTRSLKHRLKQQKNNSDINICRSNFVANLENSYATVIEDDDAENSPSLLASCNSEGKRLHTGTLPEAKRTDNKLTPVKCEDLNHSASSERNVSQRLFDRSARSMKSSLTTYQIIQSCRTSKKAADFISNDHCLDLENDDNLLGVLNELKVDSQQAEVVVESSKVGQASEVACKASPLLNLSILPSVLCTDKDAKEATKVTDSSPELTTDIRHWHDNELDSLLLELRQDVGHLHLKTESINVVEELSDATDHQLSDATGFEINSCVMKMDNIPDKCVAMRLCDSTSNLSCETTKSMLAIPGSIMERRPVISYTVIPQDCDEPSQE